MVSNLKLELTFIRFSKLHVFYVRMATSEEGGESAYPYLGQGPNVEKILN